MNPLIQIVGPQALDQLSTKIRPNKRYKSDRKDLDDAGLREDLLTSVVFGSPFHVDYKKGLELLKDPNLFKTQNKQEITNMEEQVNYYKEQYKKAKANGYKGSYTSKKPSFVFPGFGSGIDIHKAIGKLPKPKAGWTLPGQLRYNLETGEILEIYDPTTAPTDAVTMQNDVDYSVCGDNRKCKNKADRKMVKSLDAVPYNERQWGHWLARNLINTKQKLGLGLN